jgi:hypothetical protein
VKGKDKTHSSYKEFIKQRTEPEIIDNYGVWDWEMYENRHIPGSRRGNGSVHTTLYIWMSLRKFLLTGLSILIPRVNVIVPVWKYVIVRIKVVVKPLTQLAVFMWEARLQTVPETMP